MMEYDLFKTLVTERIKEYMPQVFQTYRVDVRPVRKVNQKKDAFCLIPPGPTKNLAIPTLYLDDLYLDFMEDEDLDRVLQGAAGVFITWSGYEVPELCEIRLEDHKDHIIANLISRGRNQELLETIPHADLMDMAVIYRLVSNINEQGINSCIITNDMLGGSPLSPEEIQRLALENTPRLLPPRIYHGDEEGVFVVTNESGICGAAVMLDDDQLQKVANLADGDFYILPSSIHEFFAVAADKIEPAELLRMLIAGNSGITAERDQLSKCIYMYAAEEHQLRIVASYEKQADDETGGLGAAGENA